MHPKYLSGNNTGEHINSVIKFRDRLSVDNGPTLNNNILFPSPDKIEFSLNVCTTLPQQFLFLCWKNCNKQSFFQTNLFHIRGPMNKWEYNFFLLISCESLIFLIYIQICFGWTLNSPLGLVFFRTLCFTRFIFSWLDFYLRKSSATSTKWMIRQTDSNDKINL